MSLNNIEKIEKNLQTKDGNYWEKHGQAKALQLFHEMSKRVPAYKDFLNKNSINPDSIQTIADFKRVPSVDKNNYLRIYPLKDLCWDGDLCNKQWVVSTTSGSTGEPFYFPRANEQDQEYSLTAELYLRNNFSIHKKSTLYINGFAMGAWIGGIFTYQAIKQLAQNGNYSLSIISPGIFKPEIIKAVKNLGMLFDQIIIGGYPPMIKDMIDDAVSQGVNWKDYNVGFIFSAEGFTEKFRDYIVEKTHLKNVYTTTLNHYGSVDLGTMAHETPISIFIRRHLINSIENYKCFFSNEYRLPTFAQYNPTQFYFEEVGERLYCSSYSGIPLVRYDLKDHGGIYTFAQVVEKYKALGIDIVDKIKEIDLGKSIWKLPFVYVYERSDFIVKLYGANIYPETIRKALQYSLLSKSLTGKFTAEVAFDKKHNQYLAIHIELKKNAKKTKVLAKRIEELIIRRLLKENSEYRSNFKESPKRQKPKLYFWEYEHPKYFLTGVKQKWINNLYITE